MFALGLNYKTSRLNMNPIPSLNTILQWSCVSFRLFWRRCAFLFIAAWLRLQSLMTTSARFAIPLVNLKWRHERLRTRSDLIKISSYSKERTVRFNKEMPHNWGGTRAVKDSWTPKRHPRRINTHYKKLSYRYSQQSASGWSGHSTGWVREA